MTACTTCGGALAEGTSHCSTCGTMETALALPPPPPLVPFAIPEIRYYVTWAHGERGGPFTEDTIKLLIAQQRLKITDAVQAEGATQWIPIAQSKFASLVAQRATITRLASSTCPMCGANMAVVIKRSGLGLAPVILGIVLTPVCGIGIPLWIVGYTMRWGGKGKAAYRCPRCQYVS